MGVIVLETLQFGVYVGASDFGELQGCRTRERKVSFN